LAQEGEVSFIRLRVMVATEPDAGSAAATAAAYDTSVSTALAGGLAAATAEGYLAGPSPAPNAGLGDVTAAGYDTTVEVPAPGTNVDAGLAAATAEAEWPE
jgi:hypothetical protein